MKKISSTSEKGSEPPGKVSKVEIPKNPKLCCFCDFDIAEPCPECRNNTHVILKNPCPSRECILSICDEEFHLHCYQNYVPIIYGYTDEIDALNCLYC